MFNRGGKKITKRQLQKEKKMYRLIIVLAVIICMVSACTDSQKATSVLKKQGYTNIKITGYKFLACGKGDIYHTGFAATAPNGELLEGVVCAGLFKSSTVRID